MFAEILFAFWLVALLAGLGLPIARLIPGGERTRLLFAPALGLAAYGAAVTALYRWGVPVQVTFYGASILAAVSLAAFVRTYRAENPRPPKRAVFAIGALSLAVLLLILAPQWTGGPQFSVFQGNLWDFFEYLSSVSSYRRFPYAELTDANEAGRLTGSFFLSGANFLQLRPAVAVILASAFKTFFDASTEATYTYLVVLQFLSFLSMWGLLGYFFPGRLALQAFAATAFAVGFLSQYVFDINSWSQLAGASIAIAAVALTTVTIARAVEAGRNPPADSSRWRRRLRAAALPAIPIGVAWAGLLHFYPESLVVNGAAIFAGSIAALVMLRGLPGWTMSP